MHLSIPGMNGKLRNMASVYILSGEKVLLLYRVGSSVVNESYVGTGGGHFEQNELNDAKACVIRELNEETGLSESDIDKLHLRYITLRLKNNEIRQNYYFFAELKNKQKNISSNEGQLNWFTLEEATKLEMPHSAKYMFLHYVKTGRFNDKLYCGVAAEDHVSFVELTEF